jgi:hypothetical protein
MKTSIAEQLEELRSMTVPELRGRYAEVFGEESRSRHKDWLRKRIAWRTQANAEGGLSERALRRVEELANDSDLRLVAPKAGDLLTGRTVIGRLTTPTRDRRLPTPGTILTREYRGRKLVVTVLPQGFEYEGTVYRSLTAVAKAITGSHWNGLHFFGIAGKGERP